MSADTAKSERAHDLVAQGGVISVQVLNELANIGRRKIQLEWSELKLSIYDAMIVASALEAQCETV